MKFHKGSDVMTKEELKKVLAKEKNAEFIMNIEYNEKQYVKAVKISKKEISNIYYEIENNQIKEITDEKTLTYLKKNYELKPNNIIY